MMGQLQFRVVRRMRQDRLNDADVDRLAPISIDQVPLCFACKDTRLQIWMTQSIIEQVGMINSTALWV